MIELGDVVDLGLIVDLGPVWDDGSPKLQVNSALYRQYVWEELNRQTREVTWGITRWKIQVDLLTEKLDRLKDFRTLPLDTTRAS